MKDYTYDKIKTWVGKIIFVDIDHTIADTNGTDYESSKPITANITKINQLFEKNKIIYWTARGTISGIDYRSLTLSQLNSWGAKFHELIMKKPYFDLFIDDKNINSFQFFNETSINNNS